MGMPNILRRGLIAAAIAALALPLAALAQGWPTKQPIKFIVVYPPGGASDVTARIIAQKLTEALGQTVFVENKAGANGMIATEFVAKSPPDGYTILMANLGPNAISPAVYKKMGSMLRRFPGSKGWVLSGNASLTRFLGLKASKELTLWNGAIECRLLRYEVFPRG